MTKGEELIQRYLKGGMSTNEIFQFEKDVEQFLLSNAPEKDKTKLRYYAESIYMLCSGLRKLQEEGKIKEEILN